MWLHYSCVTMLCHIVRIQYINIYTVCIFICYLHAQDAVMNPSIGARYKWTSLAIQTHTHTHTRDISSVMSPRSLPQGRATTQKCTYKREHLSLPLSVSLPPLFLSLTHTLSLFSSHLKRLPKDRSKKMNRSQRVSWQQRAAAHKHYLDRQEKVIIKA